MKQSKLIIDSDEEVLENKNMNVFLQFMQRDEKVTLKNLLRIKEQEEFKLRQKIASGKMEEISESKLKKMVSRLANHKI